MTSWIVNSVVPFSSISSNAASRKRCTRCSARERAALRLRETARWRQAGSVSSSIGVAGSDHVRSRLQLIDGTCWAERRSSCAVSPFSVVAPSLRPRPSARPPSTAAERRRSRRPRGRDGPTGTAARRPPSPRASCPVRDAASRRASDLHSSSNVGAGHDDVDETHPLRRRRRRRARPSRSPAARGSRPMICARRSAPPHAGMIAERHLVEADPHVVGGDADVGRDRRPRRRRRARAR